MKFIDNNVREKILESTMKFFQSSIVVESEEMQDRASLVIHLTYSHLQEKNQEIKDLIDKFFNDDDETNANLKFEKGTIKDSEVFEELIKSLSSHIGLDEDGQKQIAHRLKDELRERYKEAYDEFQRKSIHLSNLNINPEAVRHPNSQTEVPKPDDEPKKYERYGWLKSAVKFLFGAAGEKDIAWNHFFKDTINKHFNGGRIALGVVTTLLAGGVAALGFTAYFTSMAMVVIPALPIISAIAAGIAVLALGYTIACSVVRAKSDHYSKQPQGAEVAVLPVEYLEPKTIRAEVNSEGYKGVVKEIRSKMQELYDQYNGCDIAMNDLGSVMNTVKNEVEQVR